MNDPFDDFLQDEIKKSEYNFNDNGFSDKVINSLPKRKHSFLNRKTIITSFAVLSLIVVWLINDTSIFIADFNKLDTSTISHDIVNFEFLPPIIALGLVVLSIPLIEFNRRTF